MMSEIMQTTSCADCCHGSTNRWSKCFETKPRKAALTDIKSVKTV